MTNQPVNELTAAEKATGWRLLFNGSDLSGWHPTGNPEGWVVDDGSILCTVKLGNYLVTSEQFENFQLALEFKIVPKANSGIFVRLSDIEDPVHTGIEVQILDTFGQENLNKHSCGAIYDLVAPAVQACRPAGEWNHYLITCSGPHISVELNGILVATMDASLYTEPGRSPDGTANKFKYAWAEMPRKGHIGLQDHNGLIWFRNIKIREF